jgi:hypothetical protein
MRSNKSSVVFATLLAMLAVILLAAGTHAVSANGATPSGSVDLPTAYFHPNVLYFKLGTASSATTTLTNNSAEKLLIESFDLQGQRQSDFSISSITCGFSLAPGASCTVTLSGFAANAGSLGKLVEYDNSAVGHHQVLLEAK